MNRCSKIGELLEIDATSHKFFISDNNKYTPQGLIDDAGFSKAKGRIERLWYTFHDRLITEFKINNITNMEQANVFLKEYIKKYNKFYLFPQ